MNTKVYNTIKKHNMFEKGDSVLIGLSGGADSVALFSFLLANQKALGLAKIAAAHINHGLRGIAADADEQFVRNLCAQNDIELFVHGANMGGGKKPQGKSVELWARDIRYAFFAKTVAQHMPAGTKIATAHTASDSAETLLFNITRGTGLRGIASIRPVNGAVVRPLIEVTRAEVEQYCKQNALSFVEDATNAQTVYTRNKLRHLVVPQLKSINSAFELAATRLSIEAQGAAAYMDEQAYKMLKSACKPKKNVFSLEQEPLFAPYMRAKALNEQAPPLAPTVHTATPAQLQKPQKPQSEPAPACFEGEHIFEVEFALGPINAAHSGLRAHAFALLLNGLDALDSEKVRLLTDIAGGTLAAAELKKGVYAKNKNDMLVFEKAAQAPIIMDEHAFAVGKKYLFGGLALEVQRVDYESFIKNCGGNKTLLANGADEALLLAAITKNGAGAIVRTRRAGDVFAVRGGKFTKTMKKLYNEYGISLHSRGIIPCIATGGEVLFCAGLGFARGLAPAGGAVINIKYGFEG